MLVGHARPAGRSLSSLGPGARLLVSAVPPNCRAYGMCICTGAFLLSLRVQRRTTLCVYLGAMADPQTTLNFMREQCQDLAIKINELDLDKTEHELVMKALEPLDTNRKCFRMIGNVVVERTVAEVLPAVAKNKDQVHAPAPCAPSHPHTAQRTQNSASMCDQIDSTMNGMKEMMASKQKEVRSRGGCTHPLGKR